MKLLIVEDDKKKLALLGECVRQLLPGVQPLEARSYNTGLDAILDELPDIVLLDMSLPTYDVVPGELGGRPRHFGGRELLSEVRRADLASCVIVVTQFESFGDGAERMTLEQLNQQLMAEYPRWYKGVVSYQPSESGWRAQLERLIKENLSGE